MAEVKTIKDWVTSNYTVKSFKTPQFKWHRKNFSVLRLKDRYMFTMNQKVILREDTEIYKIFGFEGNRMIHVYLEDSFGSTCTATINSIESHYKANGRIKN